MTIDGTEKHVLVSYLTLRRVLGILGVALPFILALWGFALCECMEIQDAISDYYSLRTRDALVGVLFAMAWFLFAYEGHDNRDNIAGYLACFFALGVALFPNSGPDWEAALHFVSATGLFLVLAFFALFLFTKSDKPRHERSARKKNRDRIYVVCGVIMLVCIGSIGTYKWFLEDTFLSDIKPVFALQTLALWAFGVSWFVKGQTLWRDS